MSKSIDEILDNIDVGDFPNDGWSAKAKAQIELLINEAYRKGYNDNARDCPCDKFSVKPHQHLMDDGKSYNISPFQSKNNQVTEGSE